MSCFHRSPRALSLALGLSVLLFAEGLAFAPAPVASAASGTEPLGADQDAPAAIACTSGFDQVDTREGMSLHGVTLLERGALAVGYTRSASGDEFGRRAPATLLNREGTWSRVRTRSPGREDGLMAVASRSGEATWAVGWTTIGQRVMPLAMRWTGDGWKVDRPGPRGSLDAVLTDVTVLGDGQPFAVGFRTTPSGTRQPLVIRKDKGRWRTIPIRTGRRESVTLMTVAPDRRGGLWVVGHGGPGASVGPVVYRRARGGWQRVRVPRLAGEAVLSDVVAVAANDAWSVGYHRHDGISEPLVMRWDGQGWHTVEAPRFDSRDVLLTAVTDDPAGGVWVVGAAWDEERRIHEAVAAWWDGQAWNEVSGSAGGTELHDVAGSLYSDGWAVGRARDSARATRVCTVLQSGVFGGSEPGGERQPLPTPGLTATAGEAPPADTAEAVAAGEAKAIPEARDSEASTGAASTPVVRKGSGTQKKRNARKAARRHAAARVGSLPKARNDRGVVARDVAVPAGVYEPTGTYGAVVADFDADGVEDLFIGRHGRKGRLLLNRGGTFVEHAALEMLSIDRHGCTAADIDGSGLPDLYCAVGGKRGSGLKSNELWLDPGGPSPAEVAVERGVSDPTGRGRLPVFLEATDQPDTGLVVTNSPVRVDGLPSVGRTFRTMGDGTFVARANPGFAALLGALAVQDADYDGDGREDLLLVTGGLQAPMQAGTRLYRNTRRGLVDVTSRMGIRSSNEVDAELVDLDGDGRLDLVQLSPTRLRVSTLQQGTFRKVYEARLTHGRAVASGDANGDGRADLYVVRSNGGRNRPDVMLLNRGGGRRWSSVSVPQVSVGDGEDAYAIDHDGNGLDDFLVLNGHNRRGPTQLIAFFRR